MTQKVRMPTIAQSYREGGLREFFRLGPGDLEVAASEPRDLDRTALAGALRAYHADLGTLDSALEASLARLAHPNSRAVVTGQQAGLLGGPSYSVHKGADAALLARELDREDAPAAAIYWIASQDHDAAEVAGTTLLDMQEVFHALRLDLPQGVPVGRIPWRAEWTREVEELLARFAAPEPYKARVAELLRFAVEGRTYADVFARLMHRLLGSQGLIVLDPMHPALAKLFAPALARELEHPLSGPRRIEEAAARLEALGYEPQLRRPAGATNLFLEGEDGKRRLLRFENGTFHAERAYTKEELLDLLARDPSRLSPAAGLRPIVQDSALPTAAFVVGPGEIAYGAQLREVYELHGLSQPLLWPRLSVTWLEPPVARILERFGLTAGEFQRGAERAVGSALAREREAAALSGARIEELRAQFSRLAGDIAGLDPTLEGAATRAANKTLARLGRLQEQARFALARAENTKSGQVTRLAKHLLPLGHPQEREMNFLTYLLKHGEEPLSRLMACPPGWSGSIKL